MDGRGGCPQPALLSDATRKRCNADVFCFWVAQRFSLRHQQEAALAAPYFWLYAAAAGPKGRAATGATDVVMRAEILSYSRSRGLFAGVSLEGSTLRPDNRANEKLYGRKLTVKEILRQGKAGVPASGHELISLLNQHSPKNRSEPKSLK